FPRNRPFTRRLLGFLCRGERMHVGPIQANAGHDPDPHPPRHRGHLSRAGSKMADCGDDLRNDAGRQRDGRGVGGSAQTESSFTPKVGYSMQIVRFVRVRSRRWLAAAALAVAFLGASSSPARADEPPAPAAAAPAPPPAPDRTGAFQTTPTAYSVPGYTKP